VGSTESPKNPYRVSQGSATDADVPPRRPLGTLIVASFEAFVGLIAAIRMPATIGNFEELFKGFGAGLPAVTRFVLAFRHGWWLFAIVAIAILVWIVRRPPQTRVERRRQMWSVVAFAVAFGAFWGFVALALYLPIFRLGSVV